MEGLTIMVRILPASIIPVRSPLRARRKVEKSPRDPVQVRPTLAPFRLTLNCVRQITTGHTWIVKLEGQMPERSRWILEDRTIAEEATRRDATSHSFLSVRSARVVSTGCSLKANEELAVNRSLLACCACVRYPCLSRMREGVEELVAWSSIQHEVAFGRWSGLSIS